MNCIVCGKNLDEAKSLLVQSDIFVDRKYPVKICECGLGTTEITDENTAEEANSTMYDDVSQRADIYFHALRGHFEARYRGILKLIIESNPNGNKILEIGSNIGYTLNLIKKMDFDIKGCELNNKCREMSKLLWDIPVEKDFFTLQEKFDIIIICDVLEHLPDPVVALKKLHSLLNENGLLFIQLPNINSKYCKRLKEKWHFWCVPDHRFHFTSSALQELLTSQDFIVQRTRTVSFFQEHFVFKMLKPNRLKYFLIKIINSMMPRFSALKAMKYDDGELIQLIARKR